MRIYIAGANDYVMCLSELMPNAVPIWRTDTNHLSSFCIVFILQSLNLMHSDIFYLYIFWGDFFFFFSFWKKLYHHTSRVYPTSWKTKFFIHLTHFLNDFAAGPQYQTAQASLINIYVVFPVAWFYFLQHLTHFVTGSTSLFLKTLLWNGILYMFP